MDALKTVDASDSAADVTVTVEDVSAIVVHASVTAVINLSVAHALVTVENAAAIAAYAMAIELKDAAATATYDVRVTVVNAVATASVTSDDGVEIVVRENVTEIGNEETVRVKATWPVLRLAVAASEIRVA